MSYAYHLHLAGGRYHEKSFSYNKWLAEYASQIGDLDAAERCYKRAIDDAKYLERSQDEMDCLWHMTTNVYVIWGRYEESLSNFQLLLEIKRQLGDQKGIARTSNNIGLIHDKRGECKQALELYNQSLEISKKLGDQEGIAVTLNNIGLIHDKRAVPCSSQITRKTCNTIRAPEIA
ncbi:MAG TPA: tetratricopeptide repeat protein [Candidatus Bathyarchaeia archaeon]|nr:tetratricopeptide repeat protein [Candidatus Bathyarchaeia archaeon]